MKKTKLLWIFIITLVFFNIVYYIGKWGGESILQYVSDGLPVICSFIAVICLYSAYKSFKTMDLTRISWLLILIGITLDFFAESTYLVFEIIFNIDMNQTFPTIADVFWCIGYIPMIIGLILIFIGYKKSEFPMGNKKVYIAITLGFVMLFMMLGYNLLIPIIKDTETNILSKVFYIYYPIADLCLVVPAVILIYITSLFGKAIISFPWRFMALGFIFFTIADMLYSYLGWLDLYGNGNLIDVLWHSGYLLIGLSGIYQKELLESFN